ncbi:MAG: hypothetical protein M3157_02385 [Actinomycetota bacterium]|nr:hypothetical protein [Actinomycetota bacterium]
MDKLLRLSVDGEISTRTERLTMMVETNPDIDVEGMQFWLSVGASVYKRSSNAGNVELALNILADAVGESMAPRENYQAFSAEVISNLGRTVTSLGLEPTSSANCVNR